MRYQYCITLKKFNSPKGKVHSKKLLNVSLNNFIRYTFKRLCLVFKGTKILSFYRVLIISISTYNIDIVRVLRTPGALFNIH